MWEFIAKIFEDLYFASFKNGLYFCLFKNASSNCKRKKIDVFYLVVKSQRAWICLNPSSSVCCVSCRSSMYWKRLSLTSLPLRELATGFVRHELRHRFTECQPIRHIHVKRILKICSVYYSKLLYYNWKQVL